jgi:UDP-glucuronate 4-epimerase
LRVLVTGSAGFIGSALTLKLLTRGDEVVGIDNHNNYYDPTLKERRLARHIDHPTYTHIRADLSDRAAIERAFSLYQPNRVVHLAAQAGVRYSIENPHTYIQSNIVGFLHVLEGCRSVRTEHLVYASSSSVYGSHTRMPFSVHDSVDHPLSLYAATKKANEAIAHSYSHLYGLPTTGLRFFTVYGPWGRPDMALFKFTQAILAKKPIQVFNYGNHRRDFTYIDDIVDGIIRVVDKPASTNRDWSGNAPDPASSHAPWRIYNIGNSRPVKLMDYIAALEKSLGVAAVKQLLPLQAGDVSDTYADVQDLESQFSYRPSTPVAEGIRRFVNWYMEYFNVSAVDQATPSVTDATRSHDIR